MAFTDNDKITTNELSSDLNDKIIKAYETVTAAPETAVLLASEWDESTQTQTIKFENLTATANGTITFPADITDEQRYGLFSADISIESQEDGKMTLKYNNIKPTVDIPVMIVYGNNLYS